MSDIWHKAGFHEAIDDKTKVSKDGKLVYWTMYGWNIPDKDVHDIGCEWAYLDDLLALETELERTRKVLDVARHTIGWVNQMIDEHVDKQAIKIKCEYALEQTTALEQKDVK